MLNVRPKIQYSPLKSVKNTAAKNLRKYAQKNTNIFLRHSILTPPKLNVFQKIAKFIKSLYYANKF